MARYILIDNYTGYIFGDSANIGGKIFTGSPIGTAKALDESIGTYGRSYEEVGRLASNETGYYVYRADDAAPVVQDGQNEATIAAVERDCAFVTAIRSRGEVER